MKHETNEISFQTGSLYLKGNAQNTINTFVDYSSTPVSFINTIVILVLTTDDGKSIEYILNINGVFDNNEVSCLSGPVIHIWLLLNHY